MRIRLRISRFRPQGHKVYKGLREEYGAAYKEGDVVGCYLYLPPGGRALTRKKGDVTKQKGQYFFFEDEGQPKARALEGSIIAFAVNGAFQVRLADSHSKP